MNRHDEITKRIEKELEQEGVSDEKVYTQSQEPDLPSFKEFMLDMRLQGLDPTREEIWLHMKKIINRLTGQALQASIEYDKLQRDYRNLKDIYDDLIRERK